VEGSRHARHEGVAGLISDQAQGRVRVEVLQFDEEQLAFPGAAGVNTLYAVVEGVPLDEALSEGQADGIRARLRLDRALVGLGQKVQVLEPVDGGDDRVPGCGQLQQVLLAAMSPRPDSGL
jgi:hypothetical protein